MDIYCDSSILEKKEKVIFSIVVVENNIYQERFTRIKSGLDKFSGSFRTEINAIGFALDFCIQTKKYGCKEYNILNDNKSAIRRVKNFPNEYIIKKLKLLDEKSIKVEFYWVPRQYNLAGKNIKKCVSKDIV